MEIPILNFPTYVEELSTEFIEQFNQDRQMTQFKRLMTGFVMGEKHTIAHMNGLFIYHTNQSNLNRFVTKSKWKPMKMNQIKFKMINKIEGNGLVILDDYIVEKYGKKMFGVDWHYDHSKGRNVWGHQIVDCVFSNTGIYPLLSSLYIKEKTQWSEKKVFKTKIEIQIENLTHLKNLGLNFSTVVMDSWYFCKSLTDHIERLKKDWVAQCKSNRLIKYKKKWITLKEFAKIKINCAKFKLITLGDKRYIMKTFTLRMKGMKKVRVLISFDKNGNFNFYITNRLDWNERAIATRYSRRWDIEVWHREGKGKYGLGECQLRSDDAVSKYLTLSALAATLLEIASLLSPVYAILVNRASTPELKHRWVLTELVGKLISSTNQIKDIETKNVIESILCPYKSTRGVS